MAELKPTIQSETMPEKCHAKGCSHPPLELIGEPLETSLCPGFSVVSYLYKCCECENTYQYKLKKAVTVGNLI